MRNILLSATLLATTAAMPVLADESRDIAEQANSAWSAALNSRDVEGVVSTYANDAVVMPPTDETLAGTDRIRTYMEGVAGKAVKHNGVDLYDVRRDGDTVYAAGVWSATVLEDGQPKLVGGNIVNVLQRQPDGSWKTRLQTWN